MYARFFKSVSLVLVLAIAGLVPVAVAAQVNPAAKGAPAGDPASRWDIFVGYSYFSPHDTVYPIQLYGGTAPFNFKAESRGLTESVTYWFNHNVGVQVESGQHDLFTDTGSALTGSSNSGIFTLEPGLVYRFPHGHITPFVHGLIGVADVDGPDHEPYTWGLGVTAGGGLDYCTAAFNHRLSIRLVQADYEYLHADSGVSHFSSTGAWIWGDDESVNAVKLSTGVVLGGCQGGPPPPPVALACTASPVSIYPGDPVTVTATTAELDPKLNTIYTWSGPGVTGTGTTASVANTGSLAPGTYTVKGEVKEGKPGKEGLKVGQVADCSALFTVKAFEPPTVSCTANPMSIHPGDMSTVTAIGVSPQNRPLTYSYAAVAGTISGTGTTASFNSAGAPTGAVGITCNVADDKGGTASSGTSVTIVPIPVPPLPHASSLCSISFDKDTKRPTRVDNEAKACLDQVTAALKNDPTATLVIVGNSTAAEKTPKKGKHAKTPEDFAAERAVNTKDYLVNEEQSGIDASRIIIRTGTGDSKSVEDYLVPAGATFDNDVPGTTAVDVSSVKTLTRKPIGEVDTPKKMHKKAAAKPAAGK
jgi:hypothetical protein